MSFTYKGDLRASKTVDGVTHYYYYSGNNIVSEVWGDKSLTFLYDESGVYGFIYDDGTTETLYYYLKNLQGDVICLLDETLAPVVYYHYNAYGELIELYEIVDGTWDEISLRTVTDHIAFINPLRYRSYYYDNDLKLYYLTTRYYDCVTGRFINADGLVSTGQSTTGFNMYAYCNNNPVNFVDPSGTSFFSAFLDPLIDVVTNFNDLIKKTITKILEPAYPIPKDKETSSPSTYPGHNALDFHASAGTEIYAMEGGKVISIVYNKPNDFVSYDRYNTPAWGNFVIIEAADGTQYIYAHMQQGSPLIDDNGKLITSIKKGQLIGYMGSTGFTISNNTIGGYVHLHLQIRPGDAGRSPYDYFPWDFTGMDD